MVLNYGILIQSNVPVTAYYEVNATNNPDIYALKGSNAKGTDFYTPISRLFTATVATVRWLFPVSI
ncbi:MAG: hypothetical protein R2850_03230 [Bacteroidia bacterium]